MKINHIAVWVRDIEIIKDFYVEFFNVDVNTKYKNNKDFNSYFLTFDDGFRVEIMSIPGIKTLADKSNFNFEGYAHLAISVGSKKKVDLLTKQFSNAGYTVTGEPRTTGDGYYESIILDPEGNKIEITI